MTQSQLQNTLAEILTTLTDLRQFAQELVHKKVATKERKTRDALELYSEDFMIAWNTYNKKTGKLPAAKAYAAFKKRQDKSLLYIEAGFETPDQMLLEKIKAYAHAWPANRIQTGDFRVHLSTFLNQDRWQEDPADWEPSDNSFRIAEGPEWIN